MDMGFDFDVPELHKIVGLRAYAGDLKLELPWPEHTVYPNWGAVMRRADLDMQVAMLAEKQGAVIRQRTEAAPVVVDGRLDAVELRTKDGATVIDVEVVRPKITVVADGSLSRFGRALGTSRRKDYPYGLAVQRLLPRARIPGTASWRVSWTSATPTDGRCPGTGGSSRSVTGPSTSASAFSPASRVGRT